MDFLSQYFYLLLCFIIKDDKAFHQTVCIENYIGSLCNLSLDRW